MLLLDALGRHRSVSTRTVREYVVEALCRPDLYEGGEAYHDLEQRMYRGLEASSTVSDLPATDETVDYLRQALTSLSGDGLALPTGFVRYDGFSREAHEATRELLGSRGLSYLGVRDRRESLAPGPRRCMAIMREEQDVEMPDAPPEDHAVGHILPGVGEFAEGQTVRTRMSPPGVGEVMGDIGVSASEHSASPRYEPYPRVPGREPGPRSERGEPRW